MQPQAAASSASWYRGNRSSIDIRIGIAAGRFDQAEMAVDELDGSAQRSAGPRRSR